jgi:hypothetical protein
MAAPIRNEDAYENAIRRRIVANARKTWETKVPRAREIEAFLQHRGYNRNGDWAREGYADSFAGSLAKALDTYGKLSEKQVEAVLRILDREEEKKAEWAAKREVEKSLSQYIGEVGKREVFKLTCQQVLIFSSEFGICYIHLLKDDAGNRLVYKGSKHLADKDEVFTIKATIKAHNERDGEKQTILSRPVLV